jgi:imidazolonepropionase-like amidohydrolase
MSLLIDGPTILDAVGDTPVTGRSILVEGNRITAIAPRDQLQVPDGAEVIDARGKYAIPGLMNANVHILSDSKRLENALRYWDRFEDLAAESAQLALKNGVTTVFDTMGVRKPIMAVRDRINRGEIPGSRIFCAGWIVGFDGPFSKEFFGKVPDVVSSDLVTRFNAMCVENIGPDLMFLSPEQVADEIRAYLAKGVDFVKYAGNDHLGPMLPFSQRVQEAIVEEAHRAGTTAQSHTLSAEGMRVAVEAGCDLLSHGNITGHVPIPDHTLELVAKQKTGISVFPFTKRREEFIMSRGGDLGEFSRVYFKYTDLNARNLVDCGAEILLATDGSVRGPDLITDPRMKDAWVVPGEDNLNDLRDGHVAWFKAMAEKDCPPMTMLKAATCNIAAAYGKDDDLGTLEAGKIADLLLLDKDPLASAENYRSLSTVVKDGAVVDTAALPLQPVLTNPLPDLPAEADEYLRYRAR